MVSRRKSKSYIKPIVRKSRLLIIAVEGKQGGEEDSYFKMLRNNVIRDSRIQIKIIPNIDNKSSIKYVFNGLDHFIKNAKDSIKLKRTKIDNDNDVVDQAWIVIDVDRQRDNIQKYYKQIKDYNYRLAISNPCFEIWLFLHKGNIKIENDNILFIGDDKVVVDDISLDKISSQKVKNILRQIKHNINSCCHEELYFKNIDSAIKKSEQNNKAIKDRELLVDEKGKTKVHELVAEILKN